MSVSRTQRVLRRAWLLATTVVLLPAYALAYTHDLKSDRGSEPTVKGNAHAHTTRDRTTRARTTWDSVFSAPQAARGESTYAKTCSRCHQPSLGGADEAPALAGGAFLSSWNGLTLGELHSRIIKSMPTDTPGAYKRQDVVDVIAYLLRFNAFPAGKADLPSDDDALKSVLISTTKP